MNNNVLYNAAYAGFLAGTLEGRGQTSQTAADYLDITQRAQAFATEVDEKIAFDAAITTGAADPTQLDGTTATIQAAVANKSRLMQAVAFGLISGRTPTSELGNDYSALALVCAAIYTEGALLLVSP